MRVFDASSIVHAWDNYPIRQFPPLWDWIASNVEAKELVLPRVAYDEVGHVAPTCLDWLKDNGCKIHNVTNDVAQEALRIKGVLGIANDDYHPEGVDENDIIIIATAKILTVELVSDENPQPTAPKNLRRYRIPRVCGLSNVQCVNFLQYIKNSDVVFR